MSDSWNWLSGLSNAGWPVLLIAALIAAPIAVLSVAFLVLWGLARMAAGGGVDAYWATTAHLAVDDDGVLYRRAPEDSEEPDVRLGRIEIVRLRDEGLEIERECLLEQWESEQTREEYRRQVLGDYRRGVEL